MSLVVWGIQKSVERKIAVEELKARFRQWFVVSLLGHQEESIKKK